MDNGFFLLPYMVIECNLTKLFSVGSVWDTLWGLASCLAGGSRAGFSHGLACGSLAGVSRVGLSQGSRAWSRAGVSRRGLAQGSRE